MLPFFQISAKWLLTLLLVSGVLSQELTPAQASSAQLAHAQTSFREGAWANAEDDLRQVLKSDPASIEGNYLLAHTLFHEDKPKESLKAFTFAATLRTPGAEDLRIVALDYVLLGDYEEADHWATRSLQLDPRDGESWYALGRIRYTENRFTDAAVIFQKALTLMPRSVKVENNLGLAHEGLNQPDQAIACYDQAIAWEANNATPSAEPMINLGVLLTDRNQWEKAQSILQRAEGIDPSDKRVHSALGRLFARNNQLPAAQSELEQAVAADPKNSGLHFQLGQVFRREGLGKQAAAEFQQAAELEQAGRR